MIKQFTVTFSRTFNLENYNSMRVEASITHEVPEGEDWEMLLSVAQGQLRQALEETRRAQHTEKASTTSGRSGGPYP